jgi:hypothetical protein
MKIGRQGTKCPVPVTRGQIQYERVHLLKKLLARDPSAYKALMTASEPEPHPLLAIIEGGIEQWERISDNERQPSVPCDETEKRRS